MKQTIEKCKVEKGNEICTDGIYSYHEWNIRFGPGCNFCGHSKKKIIRKTDRNKPREVIFEEAIQRMKAVEQRVKRLEEEGESVEYVVPPPKNNGLVKEKKVSFWSKFKNIINQFKP